MEMLTAILVLLWVHSLGVILAWGYGRSTGVPGRIARGAIYSTLVLLAILFLPLRWWDIPSDIPSMGLRWFILAGTCAALRPPVLRRGGATVPFLALASVLITTTLL